MIGVSHIVTAFDANSVGSKVLDNDEFMIQLEALVGVYEWPSNGHGVISMTSHPSMVSSGVARADSVEDHEMFVRTWRGRRRMFAPRKYAVPVESLTAIVYTLDAYRADPDGQGDTDEAKIIKREIEVFERMGTKYVLVAVIAAGGDKPTTAATLTLLANIAGGNDEYKPTGDDTSDLALLHRIIADAQAALAYSDKWEIVADR